MNRKKESKLILKLSFCGKEQSKFCNTCGSVKDYQVHQLRFGTVKIPICDNCLERLSLDITNHLNSKK